MIWAKIDGDVPKIRHQTTWSVSLIFKYTYLYLVRILPAATMATSVPSTSNATPADLKGAAGSGLATTQTEQIPVNLSPALKEVIRRLVNKYGENKTALTQLEFQSFLTQEQQVVSWLKV